MRGILLAGLAAALLLGCTPRTPLWGPDSPRNGAGQVVDPQGGFALPGYPSANDSSR